MKTQKRMIDYYLRQNEYKQENNSSWVDSEPWSFSKAVSSSFRKRNQTRQYSSDSCGQ